MLTVICWKWREPGTGPVFTAEHVNRLRAGLERHLELPHRLVCLTDDSSGIDSRVETAKIRRFRSDHFDDTPRCRRRMSIFDRAYASQFGDRLLQIDLDTVIVGDITPIVDRPEPFVCWRVGYANALSCSFLLMDAGALQGLWDAFSRDAAAFARRSKPAGLGSDTSMLNFYLANRSVPTLGERDGFVTYFGAGYGKFEHLGIGPTRTDLPAGARLVMLGGADLPVLNEGRYPWVIEHWGPPLGAPLAFEPLEGYV